jgi:hypothetical protein
LLLPPTWFKISVHEKRNYDFFIILKNKNLDQLPTHNSLM